jgi:hypothetical protein
MIPIIQTISRSGAMIDSGQSISIKKWKEASKAMWQMLGEFWHKLILPKHFTLEAKTEYGYQDRTAKYMRYKARRYGHQLPLVLTGHMQRDVERIRDVRPTGDSDKRMGAVHIVLHGPSYLYMYRKDAGAADKGAELRAISEKDAKTLSEQADKFIHEIFKEDFNPGQVAYSVEGGHRES